MCLPPSHIVIVSDKAERVTLSYWNACTPVSGGQEGFEQEARTVDGGNGGGKGSNRHWRKAEIEESGKEVTAGKVGTGVVEKWRDGGWGWWEIANPEPHCWWKA